MNSPMDTDIRRVEEELAGIRNELKIIRETMPDKDMFLNAEESKLLAESISGKTRPVSSAALRKQLSR